MGETDSRAHRERGAWDEEEKAGAGGTRGKDTSADRRHGKEGGRERVQVVPEGGRGREDKDPKAAGTA